MRVGLVSKWHVHAPEYAKGLQENPDCEIAAVWDEREERGLAWAEELHCPFYTEYETMLLESGVDAVVICAPTSLHQQLMMQAAHSGKHIFTEKILTAHTNGALEIKKAIEQNGVHFAISLPHKCVPELIAAKGMVDRRELGEITYARVRNVHNGSLANWLPEYFYDPRECGGGAMIDLGAHPMYTLAWFLGMPERVLSVFTNITGRAVEDNAVSLMEFEGGTIGVSETGFVSVYTPYTMEISGTAGSLLIRNGLFYANQDTDGNWIAVKDLPAAPPSPLDQWIAGIRTGKTPEAFNIQTAVNLTRLMEAAYQSYQKQEGVRVS